MRTLTAVAAFFLLTTGAHAISPGDKCEATKLKWAGKYALCLLKAEAKAVETGGAPDYSLCDAHLIKKWTKAETAAGLACPSYGDRVALQTLIAADTNDVLASIRGSHPARLLATGQTTRYGAGSDGVVQAGVARSYSDNGNGTITDNNTGLMWEKKSDNGDIHDKDNSYSWTLNGVAMDGTIVRPFLYTLNDVGDGGANCFAGHCDWRIPNIQELHSIAHFGDVDAAVDATFDSGCTNGCSVLVCSCTKSDPQNESEYWSSTTERGTVGDPGSQPEMWAYYMTASRGHVSILQKDLNLHVRAVRGGL